MQYDGSRTLRCAAVLGDLDLLENPALATVSKSDIMSSRAFSFSSDPPALSDIMCVCSPMTHAG